MDRFESEFNRQVEEISRKYEDEIERRYIKQRTKEILSRCSGCFVHLCRNSKDKGTPRSGIEDRYHCYYEDGDENLDGFKSYSGTPSQSIFQLHSVGLFDSDESIQQRSMSRESSIEICDNERRTEPLSKSQPVLRQHTVEVEGYAKSCALLRTPMKPKEDDSTKASDGENMNSSYSKSQPDLGRSSPSPSQQKRRTTKSVSKSCAALRRRVYPLENTCETSESHAGNCSTVSQEENPPSSEPLDSDDERSPANSYPPDIFEGTVKVFMPALRHRKSRSDNSMAQISID